MRKLILSLVAIVTIALTSFGQAPEGFKYQAVVRDASSNPMTDQAVGMQITIQQGSIGGAVVYQETFASTTNGYGLVNLEIGTGTSVDDFSSIDWSNGPYFIETAVDVTGGTSYAVMGTSQLMSVPYALYAKTSGNGEGPQGEVGPQGPQGEPGPEGPPGEDGQGGVTTSGTGIEVTGNGTSGDPYIINNSQAGFEHYIGEIFGGGIIYYLWKDLQGIEHGLIINPNPLINPNPTCMNYEFDPITGTFIEFPDSSGFESNGTNQPPVGIHDGHEISIWADNYFSGNSFYLPESAAINLNDGGYTDWYIPSTMESRPFVANGMLVQKTLFENYGINITKLYPSGPTPLNNSVRSSLSYDGTWESHYGCVFNVHCIRKF